MYKRKDLEIWKYLVDNIQYSVPIDDLAVDLGITGRQVQSRVNGLHHPYIVREDRSYYLTCDMQQAEKATEELLADYLKCSVGVIEQAVNMLHPTEPITL